jgi:hypothetical protein
MQAIKVTVGPLASASANNIATSQTTAGAANLNLNGSTVSGGVATLDTYRQVLITNVGNDAALTFTVYGTTFGGVSVSETVNGTSGSTVATNTDFKTVTRVAVSGATSGSGVTVGTNGVAGSRWVRFDDFAPTQITVQANVTGTVNYSIQTTLNDPNDPFSPTSIVNVVWLDALDANIVAESTAKSGYFAYAPKWARLLLNSGSGTASATFLQSSNGPF